MSSTDAPSRPLAYFQQPPRVSDLEQLGNEILAAEQERQEAFDTSRTLQIALVHAKASLETSHGDKHDSIPILQNLFTRSMPQNATRQVRSANLSQRVQEYARFQAFLFFLETGKLQAPSLYATDEEYLAGACMGLAQDLARYGLGRAIESDIESIQKARDLVQAILEYLLEFDFRNGPLRRKYDGTKYALQSLETLLYELSVTTVKEPVEKKRKTSNDLLPRDELEALRLRMANYDNLREVLIKTCRDGQKAAKQAIFALHRGNPQQAQAKILECEECISTKLLPTIQQEPSLRQGSFSNVVEEYVEAKLFYTWLHGKEHDGHDNASSPSKILLSPQDFDSLLKLQPEEYIGGLCDLTGEVGRFAVQRGTVRDKIGIQACLETNASILYGLQTLPRLPGNVHKKLDHVKRSVEKLERMLYLQTASEATGGRNMQMPSSDNAKQEQHDD